MDKINIKRKIYCASRLGLLRSEAAFSLLELMMGLFILFIAALAFTPFLVNSIDRINYAGDKSEALYQGQSDIEVDIAERTTVDGYEMVFNFDGTEIIVPGGLVEAEKTAGSALAWLSGFVPYVPAINLYLAPLPLAEGYNPIPIIIMGRSTEFALAQDQGEQFKLYNKNGVEVSGHSYSFEIINPPSGVPTGYDGLPANYDEYAKFTLAEGLTNSNSIYRVVLKWTIEGGIEVTVRSRLQIVLPYAVAVGAGQRVWVSPDSRNIWKYKLYTGLGLGSLRDIIWTGFEFIGITSTGRIVVWREGEQVVTTGPTFSALNSACYGGGNYILAGQGGDIYKSSNATNWSKVNTGGSDLWAVRWDDLINSYVAVGNGGRILASTDGTTWSDESLSDSGTVNFRGVAYGASQWLAVGADGGSAVIYKNAGSVWEKAEIYEAGAEQVILELPGLNDIIFDGTRFIAVGNNGTLITSTDGSEWTQATLGTSSTLYAVDWGDLTEGEGHYLAVGAGGAIFSWTGDPADPWSSVSTGITQDIYGVTVRWSD